MAMPELLGVSPLAPPPGPRLAPRLRGLGLVLAGLAFMAVCFAQAVKAAGFASHTGTLTVGHCRTERSSGRTGDRSVCSGVFRSADGGSVRTDAEVDGWYVPGERVAVYREASFYAPVRMRACWAWSMFFFLALVGASQGLVILVAGFTPRSPGECHAADELVARSRLGSSPLWLRRVGLGGLVLSLVLACVSP
ncbi:hypothetical protein AB0K09_25530 [Streptomyces sp. NPDC049577]|uniref:hypothetical protein n=1 Tax=Streptomyces sp. NPDC049577 TaxID=3155153 RepID=UPI00343EEB59